MVSRSEEQVAQAGELLLEGRAGQLVVVGALQPRGPHVEGVMAGEVGVQLAVGVHPLPLEVGVVDLDRLGDEHAVGGGDRSPALAELAHHRPAVADVLSQLLGLEHLHPIELDEQQRVQHQEPHAQAGDLAVHGTVVPTTPAASASTRPRWADSSEIRINKASST